MNFLDCKVSNWSETSKKSGVMNGTIVIDNLFRELIFKSKMKLQKKLRPLSKVM
jgi:hypothetical protein